MNKKMIQERFNKAIKHYDFNAVAQKEICEKLFSLIPTIKSNSEILELGCGTGNLSKLLCSLNPKRILLNDIVQNCTEVINTKIDSAMYNFSCSDAVDYIPQLKEKGEKFDLIAAASVIQWLDNPIKFLTDCKELLKPNGILAVSTFTKENVKEVTTITDRGLDYPSIEEYRAVLDKHYNIIECFSDDIVLNFHTPFELLLHLKLTGATATSNRGWTREDMRNFEDEYIKRYAIVDKNNSEKMLCPLTYTPTYILLTNK